SAKRAPDSLLRDIAALADVRHVEGRITEYAVVRREDFAEPITGRLVSLPDSGLAALNRLHLRAGRSVSPGNPDEVVVSEPFAEAHGLRPGDSLDILLNGTSR